LEESTDRGIKMSQVIDVSFIVCCFLGLVYAIIALFRADSEIRKTLEETKRKRKQD